MRHFITEIVSEEECDEAEDGSHISHLELYIRAMEKVGANTEPIKSFLTALDNYDGSENFEEWLGNALQKAPKMSQEHVKKTMNLAMNGSIWEVAAVFTFGREDIIPKV